MIMLLLRNVWSGLNESPNEIDLHVNHGYVVRPQVDTAIAIQHLGDVMFN